MSLSIIIRKIKTLYNIIFNPIQGVVYMLHRVKNLNIENLFPNENLKVSPDYFENFVKDLKKTHTFISLDELCEIKYNNKLTKKPFAVFTFDDGYKDNFEIAYPILKKHNVPFTIYITNGLIDGTSRLWWYELEEIIKTKNQITLTNGLTFECADKKSKENTFIQIRQEILKLQADNFEENLIALIPEFENIRMDNKELMMSWNQINELCKDPLCTIAAHTDSHSCLRSLNISHINDEIVGGANKLAKKIGKNVEHFAYPFGSVFELKEDVVSVAKNAGFKTITISFGGKIRKFDNDLLHLKRVMLTENLQID